MADLNLFGSKGFQNPVVSEEALPLLKQEEESVVTISETRPMKKANKSLVHKSEKRNIQAMKFSLFFFRLLLLRL